MAPTASKSIVEQLDSVSGASLVLISQGIGHGYDLARHFAPDGSLGAVLTHSRPVVYRAIKQLESLGLVTSTEAVGVRGQLKWTLTCTPAGRRTAREWLTSPVEHLRDLRSDFLVRVLLMQRTGDDTREFVRAQRAALAQRTTHILANTSRDAVSLWRREQARAALRFLDELEGTVTPHDDVPASPMNLSARNQLHATVVAVKHGDILSSVRLDIDENQSMTSTITREAVDSLRLAPGARVVALCKATDVMIATDQSMIA
ncbi:MAG: TOBE domain-containing protein [Actinomycetota bacterium]